MGGSHRRRGRCGGSCRLTDQGPLYCSLARHRHRRPIRRVHGTSWSSSRQSWEVHSISPPAGASAGAVKKHRSPIGGGPSSAERVDEHTHAVDVAGGRDQLRVWRWSNRRPATRSRPAQSVPKTLCPATLNLPTGSTHRGRLGSELSPDGRHWRDEWGLTPRLECNGSVPSVLAANSPDWKTTDTADWIWHSPSGLTGQLQPD